MLKSVLLSVSVLALIACGAQSSADAAPAPEQSKAAAPVEKNITIKDLGNDFYMLLGPGGNIGVSVGEDGVYVIDDKFARFGEEIIARIGEITDQPIKYVLNTHHHGDHTGANAVMKTTGATVMAHDNVRVRMSEPYKSSRSETGMSQPTDPSLWPTLTFSDTTTLHFNGHTVKQIHVPSSHTDGDSIVHFVEANIVHMGDNFFLGMFPFVDVDSGGNLNGMIAAQEKVLSMINADTQVIPGHGPLAGRAELESSIATLKTIRDRVQKHMTDGKTLDEIIAAKPLADMSDMNGFIKEDGMVTAAYRSLQN
ncbi:MBL fold metallo-hydrolase [Litorimonas sp. RW-G-Af-16]|uniref:MBL fold metallo-hydrolase n=1 Tax=Litorimonas sp. RW-G-Af-16 TaxID=3241168 RepID=UPI00390C4EEA